MLINGNALDLSSLETTDKTSLVAAINELFASGGGGGTTLVLAAVWVALTLITSCAPPPDGPDAPRIIDPVHGPNYGPQP
jgi:hypothetical protein